MLQGLMRQLVEHGGSDLHLLSGQPARMRRHGVLDVLQPEPAVREQLYADLTRLMPGPAAERFRQHNQVDFAYEIPGLGRFRLNVFEQLGGLGVVLRAIPQVVPSMEQLELPPVFTDLCRQRNGLILVTGKTGAGKSTTLAAMIDYINGDRPGHIITIEDPIEFLHRNRKCLLSQREVGTHTPNFASALRSALREDPDVLLLGELRDLESISLAVTAAETGMLVLCTLHTDSADASIDRIVDAFPTSKQAHVRAMVATSLRGVVSQQLLPRPGGDGRVAALEILINTAAIGSLIRRNQHSAIRDAMRSGAAHGMQTMDQALQQLVSARRIEASVAADYAMSL